MKHRATKILSLLLTLGLLLGLLPGMSLTAYADGPTSYPLLVGGTRVTSANAEDIFNDSKASYNAGTNTLTLNGYSFSGEKNGIAYYGDLPLNIILTGSNTITTTGNYMGIWVSSNSTLNLSGPGSLSIECQNNSSCIVNTFGNITIESGTVIAQGLDGIVSAQGNVIIEGGNVTLKGDDHGLLGVNVTINGGTVTASGKSYGIYGNSVTISGGQVTAKGGSDGTYRGIYVRTSAKLSWTNPDDFIDISDPDGVLDSSPVTLDKAFLGSDGKIYNSANAQLLSSENLTSIRLSPALFTVTWKNEDGTVLETDTNVPYGAAPSYDGPTPVKPGDAQYAYAFSGWTPEKGPITGDTTYTATYTNSTNSYTVTWKNDDGTVLETDLNVPHGTTPEYNGPTPTKAGDAQYTYAFSGWSPAISAVTGNTAYTAAYTKTPIQPATFTVTYKPGEGSGAEKQYSHKAGETHTVEGNFFSAPTGKVFADWQGSDGNSYKVGAPIVVNADLTLTAQWKDKGEGGEFRIEITGDISFPGGGFGGGGEWYDGGGYVAPQRAWRVSLAPMVNGSAALGLMSGESTTTDMNVYPNTSIYVFPNPDPGYRLDKIIWSLIDGSASYDITEAKNFVMPAMDAVVYVTFRPAG